MENKKPRHLSDGDHKTDNTFDRNIYVTLLEAYRPFLGRVILALSFGFIARGLLLGNANVIGYWVDSFCKPETGIPCKPVPAIFQNFTSHEYIQVLLAMSLAGFGFLLFYRVYFSRLSARAVSSIYDEVTFRTSRLPMSFFDHTPAGRIITRFSSDYGNVFRLFGGPLAEFLAIIFDLILMIILIAIAGPVYLVFVALVAVLNYFTFKLNQKTLRTSRRDLSASRSPSIAHFAETTQGASTIRSFRRQNSFTDRFENLDRFYLEQKMKTIRQLLGFSFQMNSLTALLLLATGISAYFMVLNGWTSVGSVGVAFSFIALSGNTVQMFFEWLTQFEEAMIGVERLDKYLRKDIEPGNHLPAQVQFRTQHPVYSFEEEQLLRHSKLTDKTSASIEVDNLWFRYREDLPWVLKGIDFTVKPGERIGIIGRTGSGKSSLIQALFYLYPLAKGKISIDQQSPRLEDGSGNIDLNLYRKSIAFIAQEPILFQGSLRSNLDIASEFSTDRLLEVLDQVGLKEWVLQNPLGLEMPIAERGKNLSLGERQLLCMARCLLQDAPVVIMDEATSSVDPQSEEILVRATEEFFSDRTQIIIAHRLSTLAKCDRILWLQNGEIVALGPTHEVLPRFEKSHSII